VRGRKEEREGREKERERGWGLCFYVVLSPQCEMPDSRLRGKDA